MTIPKPTDDLENIMKDINLDDCTTVQTTEPVLTIDELIEKLSSKWLLPDTDVVRVLLAGVVGHKFSSDPLWIFLIAPPSSLKTELISSLDSLEDVYQISSLTPQTLFSGLKKIKGQEESNSILERIGDKIITLKDFTTVLSMRWEDRAVVLSQLREIYDGSFKAKYGNSVEVNWAGRIGLVAGVTPAIDTHYAVFQTLGERFIQFRIDAVGEEDLTKISLKSLGSEKTNRSDVRNWVSSFVNNLEIPDIKDIKIPEDIQDCLGKLASFVVRARSGTVRDSYKKTLEYIPEPEAPARLVKQLATLACSLAVLDKRKEVTKKDYYLTLKVGFDCVPRQRMNVLNFVSSKEEPVSTTEVAEAIDYSPVGATMHLEDLVAHELLKVDRQGIGHANMWEVSPRSIGYFKGLLTKEMEKDETDILRNAHEYEHIKYLILKTDRNGCNENIISTTIPGTFSKTPKNMPKHGQKVEFPKQEIDDSEFEKDEEGEKL